ncbi:MAG TPA: dienelactone hydrolase family protein [Tepidisphaeraceae bacterium]|jgi:dienelactone hydrolase
MKYVLAAIGMMLVLSGAARAAIKSEPVEYRLGDMTFKSVIVYDDAVSGKLPGIAVYPEWWGLDDYAKHRAQMLAELGYVAIAVDLYGNGQSTQDPAQAGKWAGALKADRKVLRDRANAGLEQLKKNSRVDGAKLGAIGYCFGGATAIELGRSGADVKAIATFHAALDSPSPADGKNIKGRLLVCHGGDDTFETPKDIEAFEQEMRQNHVDWEMNVYGGAVHSFSNPGADKHGIPGIAYNAKADQRSWQAMRTLFEEVFGNPAGKGMAR